MGFLGIWRKVPRDEQEHEGREQKLDCGEITRAPCGELKGFENHILMVE